jgi:radical SAM superfamily enzyme YgiQ (UPF0313 family)
MHQVTALLTPIILATLNAKYIHASLGLRYLLANMGELRANTRLMEFTLEHRAHDIAEQLLALSPKVIGFGVYIWNVEETLAVIAILKLVSPETRIVIGGPEVSYEHEGQAIVRLADYVITGWGDISFPKLCRALLGGPKPLMKIIAGEQPPLDQIALPYAQYSDADLKNRLLYVEASRGCPFKCEFCLSALDKTAWPFDTEQILTELSTLYERGARNFKFVDRTFNLKIETSARILQFFLDRLAPDLFVHFEVIPDQLPDRLKALIAQFTPGSLQFEVGIQSFNVEVQARISRKADNEKTLENLHWLVTQSKAHVHADLIFGLPGETLESFALGFNKLHATGVHEIQLGILKRLRGTPIIRHTKEFDLRFDPQPPYAILSNSTADFSTVQRITRFARYWDLVANSGRYTHGTALLLADDAFANFAQFADWLYATTSKTHAFAHERLVDLLFEFLTTVRGESAARVGNALAQDYAASGSRGNPKSLASFLPEAPHLRAQFLAASGDNQQAARGAARQARHVHAAENTLREEIQKAAAAA